jgi:dTDP-4-dehydrorhamnose 3,5-epimerase-like enzyme
MSASPEIIKGNIFNDLRGNIIFNNEFDATAVKRIYFIENHSLDFIRGWQGHQIEQRWFMSVKGSFEIKVIKIDNWEIPSKNLEVFKYKINSDTSDVLHIPSGYITSIQALEEESKLMAMSDYRMRELQDEFRFDIQYFK